MISMIVFFILLGSDYAISSTDLIEHQPIYFVTGKPDTKIQMSFKVQWVRNVELYFAYTQLMMWDLYQRSSPFRDLNYNPAVFYRHSLRNKYLGSIDFGFFEHESNGREGRSSRSWNRSYLMVHSVSGAKSDTHFQWSLKAWIPYGVESTNTDITRYRGLYEVHLILNHFLSPFLGDNSLSLRFYPGGRNSIHPFLGGQELSFKGKAPLKALAPALVVQVFHGYGENMLDYNQKRFGLRAGFGF